MSEGIDSEREPLYRFLEFIRAAAKTQGGTDEQIAERIRFAEILWHHSPSWVHPAFLTRAINFACDPQGWEEWKQSGGDSAV